jgi:hypothetical protein
MRSRYALRSGKPIQPRQAGKSSINVSDHAAPQQPSANAI